MFMYVVCMRVPARAAPISYPPGEERVIEAAEAGSTARYGAGAGAGASAGASAGAAAATTDRSPPSTAYRLLGARLNAAVGVVGGRRCPRDQLHEQ